MMIGALMHATIFGHVTNIVHRSFARRSEYDSKWSDLKQFTELHNMPKQLKQHYILVPTKLRPVILYKLVAKCFKMCLCCGHPVF